MPSTRHASGSIDVHITSMDADLDFSIDKSTTGRELFDKVCRTIGLREVWFFGLQYTTNKGEQAWLAFEKKVTSQDLCAVNSRFEFLFLVKFYPEDVAEQLIQEVTQHLFYLQVRQAVLQQEIYCPPEAAILLASYATQAEYGDYDSQKHEAKLIELDKLMPKRIIGQYEMTSDMWQDRITTWWSNNKGMTKEEAELEYLRIAQDLDMYGITYFPIKNKKGTDLYLGVSHTGIHVYDKQNKMIPKTTIQWSEVRHVSFKNKKFLVKCDDEKNQMDMISPTVSINKVILDICVGNHNLYLRRRQQDSLEVQQMKSMANEEKLRKQEERNRWEHEHQLRLETERERDRLQQQVDLLKQQLLAAEEALRRSDETGFVLAENLKVAEEEALLLAKQASDRDAEIQRVRLSVLKTEEEKIMLERKAREAEITVIRMYDDTQKYVKETEKLKDDLTKARQSEKIARDKLRDLMTNPYMPLPMYSAVNTSTAYDAANMQRSAYNVDPMEVSMSFDTGTLAADSDIRHLSDQIEKERSEYYEKSRHLQQQLSDLRSEIEGLKVDDHLTDMDRIYEDNLQQGDTRYSTLRRSGAGSAKARISMFEGL